MHAGDRLGDQIVVLGRLQRYVDAGHAADGSRPHARAVDHDLGMNLSRVGFDADHAAMIAQYPGHGRILENSCAPEARAPGERLRHIGGIHARVVRKVERRLQIAHVGERPHLVDLRGRYFVRLDPEAMRHMHAPAHFLRFVRGHRQLDRSAIDDPRRLARLGFEPAIQILRILRQFRLSFRISQRGEESGRVPGGAGGELSAFQEHDIPPAELGQMIGDRAADHAAADDHHARLFG
jgi:hypothetical protein